MPKERVFIGEGKQHQVFLNSHINSHPCEFVLKKPKFIHALFFHMLRFSAKDIENDFQEDRDRIKNSSVKIPKTRIFPFNKSYVIAQEFIAPDISLEDITPLLGNNQYLLDRYRSNPRNFIYHSGDVYFIDPVKSNLLRLISSTGLDYYRLYHLRVQAKNLLRKFKLSRIVI